jgi:hypothetical protein
MMAAAKRKPAHPLLEQFEKSFEKSMKAEQEEHARAPKVHDHRKGEYVREVDPKRADKHLE